MTHALATPALSLDPEACWRRLADLALPTGGRILLGVSGGTDSLAMLRAATRVLPGRCVAVHVHHRLRPEAEDEARHVEGICAALGVRLRHAEAGPSAEAPGRSEPAARRRRLSALTHAARQSGIRQLALAHHLDDELETIVLRLQRGHDGDRACVGIPSVRPLDDGFTVLRPFVGCTGRPALAAYLREAGLEPVEDPSNRDPTVPRSRVRAWLVGQPDVRPWLLALRARARARLPWRIARALGRLTQHLQSEGLGCCLDARAVVRPDDDAQDEQLVELLRLLGELLARRRRVDPRASVVRRLRAAISAGHGRLRLPAGPDPIELEVSPAGLHLPDESLADGDAATRALSALLRQPAYL